jgi:hypothetical protein
MSVSKTGGPGGFSGFSSDYESCLKQEGRESQKMAKLVERALNAELALAKKDPTRGLRVDELPKDFKK